MASFCKGQSPKPLVKRRRPYSALWDISTLTLLAGLLLWVLGSLCMPAATPVATTIVVQSSSNPSVLGQGVTLAATVYPAVATGTVTWYAGTSILGVSAVKGGNSTLTPVLLPFGLQPIKAFYSGDSNYQSSTSTPLLQNVLTLGQNLFHPVATIANIHTPGPAAIGDFNGDGHPDVAVIATLDSNVSVLLGNGDGTFGPPANYGVGAVPLSVAVGDFNGDGHSDLVVSNSNDSNVSVLLGDGKGAFRTAVDYPVGAYPRIPLWLGTSMETAERMLPWQISAVAT